MSQSNFEISSLSVENLFGAYSYNIQGLNSNPSYIIGPNGSGKTTILNLIHAICQKNWAYISRIRFDALKVKVYVKNKAYIIHFQKNEKGSVDWDIYQENDTPHFHELAMFPEEYYSFSVNQRARWIHKNFSEVSFAFCGRHWKDAENQHMNASVLVKKYEKSSPPQNNSTSTPELIDILESFKTKLIPADRLVKFELENNENEDDHTHIMMHISRAIQLTINRNFTQAFQSKLSLDNDFINRWLKGNLDQHSQFDLFDTIREVNDYEQLMREFGFEPNPIINNFNDSEFDEKSIRLLGYFLKSRLETFSKYDDSVVQLSLFKSIVNNALQNKWLEINYQNGITVETNLPDKPDITDLSSGEQQIISMNYEIIFNSPRNSIVLLDEPELSMHTTWQEKFSSSLKEISEIRSVQFICATHSPAISAGQREALIRLKNVG